MLTSYQQKFLIQILGRGHITQKEDEVYSSPAFYKTVSYLKKNNLIFAKREKMIKKYFLTPNGMVLAQILGTLSDIDPKFQLKDFPVMDFAKAIFQGKGE